MPSPDPETSPTPRVALRTTSLDVSSDGWLVGAEPLAAWRAGGYRELLDAPLRDALNRLAGLPGGFLAGLLPYPAGVNSGRLGRQGRLPDFPATPATLLLFDHRDAPLPLRDHGMRFTTPGGFRACMSPRDYQAGVSRILEYLRAGDAYQVNLAQRFSARCDGNPWAAFARTTNQVDPGRAGWFDLGDRQILCFSPESFLDIEGQTLRTSPIKGTRRRGLNAEDDQRLVDDLRRHPKDRAENLMIVDLLRNDLGRVCLAGSIRATRLFDVESHAYVHHLVSTVEGRLPAGAGPGEALLACFPGGSITGAPKRRAMEIINELEPSPRDIYCGSLFWVLPDGRFGSNICIRTFLVHDGQVFGWSGAGIISDSDPRLEQAECLTKLERLMSLVSGD